MADHEREKSPAQMQLGDGQLPNRLDTTMGVLETSEPRRLFMEGAVGEPTDLGGDEGLILPDVSGGGGNRSPIDPPDKSFEDSEGSRDAASTFSPSYNPNLTICVTNHNPFARDARRVIPRISFLLNVERNLTRLELSGQEQEQLDGFQTAADTWLIQTHSLSPHNHSIPDILYAPKEEFQDDNAEGFRTIGKYDMLLHLGFVLIEQGDADLLEASMVIFHEKAHGVSRFFMETEADATNPRIFDKVRSGLEFRDGETMKGSALNEAVILLEQAVYTQEILSRFPLFADTLKKRKAAIEGPEFAEALRWFGLDSTSIPSSLMVPFVQCSEKNRWMGAEDRIQLVYLAALTAELLELSAFQKEPISGMKKLFDACRAESLEPFYTELRDVLGDELFDEVVALTPPDNEANLYALVPTINKLVQLRDQMRDKANPLSDEIIRFLESQGYATASVFEATATDEAADRMQEVYMSTDEYNFRSQLNSLLPLEVKRPVFIRHRDIPMDEFLDKHGLNLADGRVRTTEEAEIAIMVPFFISAIIDNPLGIYSQSARRGKRSLLADGVDETIINEAIELGLAARAGIDREIEAIIDSANPQTDSNRWFGALLAYRAALHNKAVHTGRSQGRLRSLGDTIIDIDRAVATNSLGQLIGDDSNALVLGWDTDKYDAKVGMECVRNLHQRVAFDWETLLDYPILKKRLKDFLDEIVHMTDGLITTSLSKDNFEKVMQSFLELRDEMQVRVDSGEDSELAQLWQYKLDVSSKIGKASRSFL